MNDTKRLRWIMDNCGIDGIHGLKIDRYDYAQQEAEKHGREEPNTNDELSGFRRMLDTAIEKYGKT